MELGKLNAPGRYNPSIHFRYKNVWRNKTCFLSCFVFVFVFFLPFLRDWKPFLEAPTPAKFFLWKGSNNRPGSPTRFTPLWEGDLGAAFSQHCFLGNYHVRLDKNALCWKLIVCLICSEIPHLRNCTRTESGELAPDKHCWDSWQGHPCTPSSLAPVQATVGQAGQEASVPG